MTAMISATAPATMAPHLSSLRDIALVHVTGSSNRPRRNETAEIDRQPAGEQDAKRDACRASAPCGTSFVHLLEVASLTGSDVARVLRCRRFGQLHQLDPFIGTSRIAARRSAPPARLGRAEARAGSPAWSASLERRHRTSSSSDAPTHGRAGSRPRPRTDPRRDASPRSSSVLAAAPIAAHAPAFRRRGHSGAPVAEADTAVAPPSTPLRNARSLRAACRRPAGMRMRPGPALPKPQKGLQLLERMLGEPAVGRDLAAEHRAVAAEIARA